MEAVIVHQVSKRYPISAALPPVGQMGKKEARLGQPALQEVSLRVEQGEIFGILGDSGAGKTILLRLVAGMLKPDAGYIQVLGFDTLTRFGMVQRLVNPVGLDTGVLERLSPLENLVFSARLAGSHASDTCLNGRLLLAKLGLDLKMIDTALCSLPKSARRKTALARALLSPARVLLLDDPLDGLSLAEQAQALHVLRHHARHEPRTVLLSSRVGEHIRAVCDRYITLDSGRLVPAGLALGQPAGL